MSVEGTPKVTIVGAGFVGSTAASFLLRENIADIVLVDVAENIAKGKALDLNHMAAGLGIDRTVVGTKDYKDTADSDIVVVTAGVARKPGMTREDLLDINWKIVQSVMDESLKVNPQAIYLFVTNPLDVMVNAAAKKYQLSSQKLFGMGGELDSARFAYTLSHLTGVAPSKIEAVVIGAHGADMLPLTRFSKVDGNVASEILSAAEVLEAESLTVAGGAAVVEYLQTGSAYFAPGSSVNKMVKAILSNTGETISACVQVADEYDIADEPVFVCLPSIFDQNGLKKIVQLDLNEVELKRLRESAQSILKQTKLIV